MTKTLTEQWREHNLTYNQNYYLLLEDGREDIQPFMGGFFMSESNEVKEVLAPVPSYERIKDLDRLDQFCELILAGEKQEWENIVKRGNKKEMARWLNERKNKTVDRLEKKLKIATKALNEYKEDYFISEGGGMSVNPNPDIARKALKEIKEVK